MFVAVIVIVVVIVAIGPRQTNLERIEVPILPRSCRPGRERELEAERPPVGENESLSESAPRVLEDDALVGVGRLLTHGRPVAVGLPRAVPANAAVGRALEVGVLPERFPRERDVVVLADPVESVDVRNVPLDLRPSDERRVRDVLGVHSGVGLVGAVVFGEPTEQFLGDSSFAALVGVECDRRISRVVAVGPVSVARFVLAVISQPGTAGHESRRGRGFQRQISSSRDGVGRPARGVVCCHTPP
ncbi:hypothetical protein [Halomontanus rarus]|uniref:hypothetical protein n=1 Tax=Halomontanus rarus TaxID=3034020 RepID=UPI0023E76981|nr:hypothetical protein [Halovivax sp. TS33]